jgi:hypothetical protein
MKVEPETTSGEHRMSAAQVLEEWRPAGFRLVEKYDYLPTQHLFIFAKAR